jgi:hypothetical protein
MEASLVDIEGQALVDEDGQAIWPPASSSAG